MPRSGSGSCSLAEPAFIANTPIVSADVNSDLDDIIDMLTDSLSRSGDGGMQAALKLDNDGFTYLTDPNTGMSRSAADEQVVTCGGVDVATFKATALDVLALEVAGVAAFPVPTAQIADGAVTYAKIQDVSATSRLLGRATAGAGDVEEITLDTTLAISGGALKVSPSTGLTAALAVDYATQADQEAATSTTKTVNPSKQQFHPSAAKAWASVHGTTGALINGYNIASAARSAPGTYTVTFTTPFSSSTAYSCQATVNNSALGTASGILAVVTAKTASVVSISVVNLGAGAAADCNAVDVLCFGDQ